MKKILSLAAVALLSLSACGGGSSTSATSSSGSTTTGSTNPTGGAAPTGAPVTILGVSGAQVSLSGTWIGTCVTTPGGVDNNEALFFSSSTGTSVVVYAQFSYTSGNGSCTGTSAQLGSFTADVALGAGGTGTIQGWEFSPGVVGGAPQAQNGAGPLLTNESFTYLTFTVTASTGNLAGVIPNGTVMDRGYVLDDTAALKVLYRLKGGATPATLANPAIAESFDSFSK